MNLSLELSDVTKCFGEKVVYDGLHYTFGKGCYAVYGQNGIGKSVLLEMIAGVTRQEKGFIRLNSALLSGTLSYKMRMAYVPSVPAFFPMIDGNEYLSFIQSLKGASVNLQQHICGYQLNNHLASKFGQMSLGTQKKLFLTTLAIGNNSLIVLDEPTNGLDDESIRFLMGQIKELSQNAIVLIATHDSAFMSVINHTAIQLDKAPIAKFSVIDIKAKQTSLNDEVTS